MQFSVRDNTQIVDATQASFNFLGFTIQMSQGARTGPEAISFDQHLIGENGDIRHSDERRTRDSHAFMLTLISLSFG